LAVLHQTAKARSESMRNADSHPDITKEERSRIIAEDSRTS